MENKINVIIYCLIDLFKCIDTILNKTSNNAALYCLYYSTTKNNKISYHRIIHTLACEYLLKSNILLQTHDIPPIIDLGLEFNPDFKEALKE